MTKETFILGLFKKIRICKMLPPIFTKKETWNIPKMKVKPLSKIYLDKGLQVKIYLF